VSDQQRDPNGPRQPRIDPQLAARRTERGRLPGDAVVRVIRQPGFRRRGSGVLVATDEAHAAQHRLPRLVDRFKRLLIGEPLASARAHQERLTKTRALGVLSSDALSSSAYATEQILIVLLAGGALALTYTPWVAVAITALLVVVGISYRQTIKAYPQGGGSYIVTKDNLGQWPSLIAASALLFGYILTVAVSVAAGVAAVTSAFPALLPYAVHLAVVSVGLLTVVNLRGVRESGAIFSVPTYLFIALALVLIAVGIGRLLLDLGPAGPIAPAASIEPVGTAVTAFLVLHAFAAGCAALAGVEAISDAVPAFEPPEWQNARSTLVAMLAILAVLFLGLTFLTVQLGVLPIGGETVLSQVNRAVFGGDSTLYYLFQAAAAMILFLAANTAFADFPRLAYFLARDHFMPHQFSFRGDRLAFSTGIIVLGLVAAALLVAFGANTQALIPLYAVGVFLAFTMSQSGMVVRWWRRREPGWRGSLPVNLFGAVTTGLVAIVVGLTQFVNGAWITVLLIPLLVAGMWGISRHYLAVREQIDLPPDRELEPLRDLPIVVPVPGFNRVVARTLEAVAGMSRNVVAVHVSDDPASAEQLRAEWRQRVTGIDLVILESPYREVVDPLLAYLDALQEQAGDRPIVVALSEHVPRHLHEFPLHNQTALSLKARLFFRPNTIVMDVPYHLTH
jgi:amino acid transporter